MSKKSLSQIINDRLAAKGMNRSDLSRATGIRVEEVSRVMHSKVRVTARMAVRLGEALGINPAVLMAAQAEIDIKRELEKREEGL